MADAYARPTGPTAEPLYDVDVPTPTHAERARTLVAQAFYGHVVYRCTRAEGYPYGSFVTVAFDGGAPVFLLSSLAERLTPEQRAEGQKLSREWFAAHPRE